MIRASTVSAHTHITPGTRCAWHAMLPVTDGCAAGQVDILLQAVTAEACKNDVFAIISNVSPVL